MDAVQTRAHGDPGERELEVLVIGRNAWSLGPAGPIVRAAGIGFGIGVIVMTVVTLLGA